MLIYKYFQQYYLFLANSSKYKFFFLNLHTCIICSVHTLSAGRCQKYVSDPWNWSYRDLDATMQVLRIELRASVRVHPTAVPSLHPQSWVFNWLYLNMYVLCMTWPVCEVSGQFPSSMAQDLERKFGSRFYCKCLYPRPISLAPSMSTSNVLFSFVCLFWNSILWFSPG